VGNGAGFNSIATQINQLVLGTGLTTLDVSTLNVGTGTRDIGSVTFATAATGSNSSIVLRGADGSSPVAINEGTGGTGVTTGTGIAGANNLVDFSGHNANLLISTLAVGNQARVAVLTSTFNFDTGLLNATTVQVGFHPGTATSTATLTDIINLGVGNTGAVGTVNIGTGGLEIGNSSYNQAGIAPTVATVNIGTGETVTIANSTTLNAAVRLATNSATAGAGGVTGTLDITGGSVTLGGNIISGAIATGGTGTNASVLTLNGGLLNMSGNTIGASAATGLITTLNFQSGTLENVSQINNGAPLVKTMAGTLILAGSNSYSGATNIQAGTLQNGAVNALPASTVITIGSSSVAAIYDLNGFNSQVGGLLTAGTASSQTVTNSGPSSAALTIANASSNTFGGVISDGVSQTSIIKAGTGALTLTSGNTYSGGTSINAGVLFANNPYNPLSPPAPGVSATGGGPVTVGASGTLGGTGSIAGAAAISGNLAPAGGGTTPLGTPLTLAGGATFNAGSKLTANIVAPGTPGVLTPGVTYDQVVFSGSIALGGGATQSTLVLNDAAYAASPNAQKGDTFWLLDGTAGNSTAVPNGLFGSTITDSAGYVFTLAYDVGGDPNGSGNDVQLTSNVPEPGTFGLLGVGALGLLARRRRRIARRK